MIVAHCHLNTAMELAKDFEFSAALKAHDAENLALEQEQEILHAAFLLRQQRAVAKKEMRRRRTMADFRMAMRSHYLNRFCLD